jgi:hypothetical protein
MSDGWTDLPEWLAEPAYAVFADLQGADAISSLKLYAKSVEDFDGVVLGLFEGRHGGGRLITPSVDRSELLCEIADVLQDELTETSAGWAQPRPACPYHSHPARPGVFDGEAWWWCPDAQERLWRLGVGELPPRKRA